MNLIEKIKKIFCLHKDGEVVCWHYVKPLHGYYTTIIEVQLYCNKCHKYYIRYVYPENFNEFVHKYKDKKWSDKCKPKLF